MTVPNSPLAPIRPLFLAPPDSETPASVAEAHALVERNPELVALVKADLDRWGCRKKEMCVADAQWRKARTLRLAGMEPLVVMYSRSLKPGDYVRIGEVEGTVTALDLMSTKIRTPRDEEVTLPSSVVGAGTLNFSRLCPTPGVALTATVTIGYDAPWRQVHALLLAAAAQTREVRGDPAPFVLQSAQSDFYPQYVLHVYVERPERRVWILSPGDGKRRAGFKSPLPSLRAGFKSSIPTTSSSSSRR